MWPTTNTVFKFSLPQVSMFNMPKKPETVPSNHNTLILLKPTSIKQNIVHNQANTYINASTNINDFRSQNPCTLTTATIDIFNLSVDDLRHITSFLTLTEYAFNMLQVNKYFHNTLSPKHSPNIMRQILATNWNRRLEIPILTWDRVRAEFKTFFNTDFEDLLEEWQIIGIFAWQNTKRKQYENIKEIMTIIDENRLKRKSYYSSLFLLHFLYKCRYGGISATVKKKGIDISINIK